MTYSEKVYHYIITYCEYYSSCNYVEEKYWKYSTIVPLSDMSYRLEETILNSIELEIKAQSSKNSSIFITRYELEYVENISI